MRDLAKFRFIADLVASVRHALQGRDDRDAVEGCQGTPAGGGCSTRAWTRRQRQRDGSTAGGHPRFLGRYLSRHPRPHPGAEVLPQARWTQPPRTPDARSRKLSDRERAGAFPPGLARGDGSRDRASGEAGMVGRGALRRERCIRKCGWPPAAPPSVRRSRHPQRSFVCPATADVRGHRLARGELTTLPARSPTKSAMNRRSARARQRRRTGTCGDAPSSMVRWRSSDQARRSVVCAAGSRCSVQR